MTEHPEFAVYLALLNEREVVTARLGEGDIFLDNSHQFDKDTLVIVYTCTPRPFKVIRKETNHNVSVTRYCIDRRTSTYIRGHRATSALISRNYVDIADPRHNYWSHDA
jgi:hypothetical protein